MSYLFLKRVVLADGVGQRPNNSSFLVDRLRLRLLILIVTFSILSSLIFASAGVYSFLGNGVDKEFGQPRRQLLKKKKKNLSVVDDMCPPGIRICLEHRREKELNEARAKEEEARGKEEEERILAAEREQQRIKQVIDHLSCD